MTMIAPVPTLCFVLSLSPSLSSMAAGTWTVDHVTALIERYQGSSAQARVAGRPLVSTFEGPDWAANWEAVRGRMAQQGGIFLMPSWTSLGPEGMAQVSGLVDGACKCLDKMLGLGYDGNECTGSRLLTGPLLSFLSLYFFFPPFGCD